MIERRERSGTNSLFFFLFQLLINWQKPQLILEWHFFRFNRVFLRVTATVKDVMRELIWGLTMTCWWLMVNNSMLDISNGLLSNNRRHRKLNKCNASLSMGLSWEFTKIDILIWVITNLIVNSQSWGSPINTKALYLLHFRYPLLIVGYDQFLDNYFISAI